MLESPEITGPLRRVLRPHGLTITSASVEKVLIRSEGAKAPSWVPGEGYLPFDALAGFGLRHIEPPDHADAEAPEGS